MVPHIAVNDAQVGEYEIKKGTVILPSIWSAHIDDFPEAEKFDPERFSSQREKDPKTVKSFLAFGYGLNFANNS
jgi:cytochrome P450 family 710 subfamily A protein